MFIPQLHSFTDHSDKTVFRHGLGIKIQKFIGFPGIGSHEDSLEIRHAKLKNSFQDMDFKHSEQGMPFIITTAPDH